MNYPKYSSPFRVGEYYIFSKNEGLQNQSVYYIQKGTVKLAVLSKTGKEAVVGILGPGAFFGEGCLAEQPRRMATASAMSAATILAVAKPQMLRLLHEQGVP